MKKGMLVLSAVALLFVACKKDKDEAVTPTVENIKGNYKITKLTVASGSNETIFDEREECAKDDLHKFNADMSYQYDDAGTDCDPEGSETSTWALTNSTTLTYNGEVYTIRKFDGTNLELTFYFGGVTFVAYFTKQ